MVFLMNAPTAIVLVIVLVLFFFAAKRLFKNIRSDGNACGCGGCNGCDVSEQAAPREDTSQNN